MRIIIIIWIILSSLVFSRRDCLKQATRDALGRTERPGKDTLAISPSGHFYIHYDITGNAAPDSTDTDGNGTPDFVDEVGIIADAARIVLTENMGYDVEPFDRDSIYDIYVNSLSPREYGFNWKDPFCTVHDTIDIKSECLDSSGTWIKGTSYLEIDNDYLGYDLDPLEIMRISLSHEFFHAIQWGYEENLSGNKYFYEMTSMWFEDVMVPEGNDYLGSTWTRDLFEYPTRAFNNTGDGYELALFGHYLSSFIDTKGSSDAQQSTIMREIWERYRDNSGSAFSAVQYILQDPTKTYNIPFIEAWVDFISRNLYNGMYDNMDNPFYYYIDQALIDPIQTNSTSLIDGEEFELELDDESAAIQSYRIGNLESIFTIGHVQDNFTGRIAIVSNDEPEMNNLFWGSNTTTAESYSDVKIHFVYGVDGTSITLPIDITAHAVPLPPYDLMAVAAQDSIRLSWRPSPGPGDSLYYVIYRDGDSIFQIPDTNYTDSMGINGNIDYIYEVSCNNEIGESQRSGKVSILSWPNEDSVVTNLILSIYPNPIRETYDSHILYALGTDYSHTTIELINIRGQIVEAVSLRSYKRGWHRENINSLISPGLAAGIYFIRLRPENTFGRSQKITILP